mgnify:CR=1 FL=1
MASAFALDDRPHVGPARFTADEFLRMEALGAFAGRKVELANGEIVEEPLPGWTHARLQAWLIGLLMRAAPAGAVAVGELSVRLSDLTVRNFDVGLTSPDVGDVPAVVPTDVLLAVEIAVTTLAVDLNDKAAEYAAAGIETVCRSLALANHLASRVLRDRRTASDVGLGLGEIIEVPILPGSTVIGRPLRSFHAHPWLVAAVYRQDRLIVPHGDTVIQAGDRVVLVGEPHVLAAIADFFKMGEPEFPLQFGRRFGLLHAEGRKPALDAAIAETGYLVKNTKADGVTLLAVNGPATAIPPDANRVCGGELRCETIPLSERRENWIGELQGRDFGCLILPASRFFIWQRLGITQSLLSSLLASSALPVLVSRGSHPYKKILAPVAIRSSPLQVAELAIDLARLLGASLSAITVTEPSFAAGSETVSEQKQILDQLQEMSSLYRLPIELLHREGNPIAEIVAEAINYDLLVLGHRRSSRQRIHLDIALEVAARVKSSVMILPNDGEPV